jgi:hypothetical protein
MSRIISRKPSAAMVVACVALFMALGGVGYAAATIGSAAIVDNSIRSKDVRNDNLRGKDVRNGSLKGPDVADGSLAGPDVADGSLAGADVADDSLSGADVNEAGLGQVPSAANADNATHAASADSATNATNAGNADTVGGVPAEALTIGRYAFDDLCEPGVAFENCATVTLPMPRAGRVLLNIGGQWHSDNPAGTSVRGLCRITVNGAVLTSATEEGSLSQQTDGNQEQALSPVTAVTGVLAAGSHTFALSCSDDIGDMDYTDTRITAVLLGSA